MMPETETLAANEWLAELCQCRLLNKSLFPQRDQCSNCHGTGKRHYWAWERCPRRSVSPPGFRKSECEEVGKRCYGCDGSGWVLSVTEAKAVAEWFKDTRDPVSFHRDSEGWHWNDGPGFESFLAAALDALRQFTLKEPNA